jgi:Epoxide hydrolase N terminus
MTTHQSTAGSVPSRRALLLNGAAIAALLAFSPAMAAIRKETTGKKEAMTKTATAQLDTGATAIRPFHIHIPEEALTDLCRRLAATRWPDKETVADQSQGVQLALSPLLF